MPRNFTTLDDLLHRALRVHDLSLRAAELSFAQLRGELAPSEERELAILHRTLHHARRDVAVRLRIFVAHNGPQWDRQLDTWHAALHELLALGGDRDPPRKAARKAMSSLSRWHALRAVCARESPTALAMMHAALTAAGRDDLLAA